MDNIIDGVKLSLSIKESIKKEIEKRACLFRPKMV